MGTRNEEPVKPSLMTIRNASVRLDMCAESVRRLTHAGTLTAIRPRGAGRGRLIYLDPIEVGLYAQGKFNELREYQRKRKAG